MKDGLWNHTPKCPCPKLFCLQAFAVEWLSAPSSSPHYCSVMSLPPPCSVLPPSDATWPKWMRKSRASGWTRGRVGPVLGLVLVLVFVLLSGRQRYQPSSPPGAPSSRSIEPHGKLQYGLVLDATHSPAITHAPVASGLPANQTFHATGTGSPTDSRLRILHLIDRPTMDSTMDR